MHGIKRVEGRDWPSKHRGRLWIHSTSKEPDAKSVQACFSEVPALYDASLMVSNLMVLRRRRHAHYSVLDIQQELQQFYRRVHGMEGHKPEFPASYPTSSLIGCVIVADVLTVGFRRYIP